MKFTAEINIPDDMLQKAVQEAALATFQRPNFGREEGAGTALVRKQVESAVATLDLRAMVAKAVEGMAHGTVEDLVREKLRKMSREELTKLLNKPALI